MARTTTPTKTAKAPAKAAAKGKAAPAKNTKGAAAAKGKAGKNAKPVQEHGALVLAPARVKYFMNSQLVNRDIEQQLGQFDDENKKVVNNTAIAKIEQDEEKVKEYVTLLTRPKAPAGLAKDEREKWEAKNHAAHAKKVEAALKNDSNLRAFKKKFDANASRLAISRNRKRFARDSYYAIATIIQEVIHEHLVCAMDVVLDCEKKIVGPDFCVTDAVQSTKYYCLIANMKTFRETYEKAKPKDEEEEAENENEDEDEPAEDAPEEHTRGFQFYVEKIGKSITNSGEKRGKYSVIRLSKGLKKYCSNLIIDMLQGLAGSLEQFLELKGAKTINADLIKTVFAGLMTYNHADAEGLIKIVDDKLAEIAKAAKNKKPAAKAKPVKGGKKSAESEESEEAEETEAADEDDDADEDDEEPSEPAPRGRARGKARA